MKSVYKYFPLEDIRQIWRERNTFVPFSQLLDIMTERRMEELKMDTAQKNICRQMRDALISYDRLTGLQNPAFKLLNLELMEEYKKLQLKKTTVHYMAADFTNLRGLNIILSGRNVTEGQNAINKKGYEATDKLLRVCANIFRNKLEEVARHYPDASAKCYRDGGDELSALIINIPHEAIQKAQDEIEAEILLLMKRTGLHNIMHPKNKTDAPRFGAGISCHFSEYVVDDDFSFEKFDFEIDSIIAGKKAAIALRNRAQEPVNKLTQEELDYAHKLIEVYHRAIPREEKNIGGFPFSREDYPVVLPGKIHGATPIPITETRAWPSLEHALSIASIADQYVMTTEQETFLGGLFEISQSPDIHSGFRRDSFNEALASSLKQVRHFRRNPSYAIIFEIQNFAGLNEKFGHAACDRIAGEIAKNTDQFPHKPLIYRPDGKGNRVYVLFHGIDMSEEARKIYSSESEETKAKVEKSIKDAIIHTYDHIRSAKEDKVNLRHIPHPRHKNDAYYSGTRIIAAAVRLVPERYKTTDEVFADLERQLSENSIGKLSFDGAAIKSELKIMFDTNPQGRKFLQEELRRREQVNTKESGQHSP